MRTLGELADAYPARVVARRAVLEDDFAHLDNAAMQLVVSLALSGDPHLHGSYMELVAAGTASRERGLDLLAAYQAARQLEREFAALGEIEASNDARADRACGVRP